ncbi:GNAT family N-acetyltransferase [Photobacterium sp. WH77]|uniref:GNAT family N-acetyltransferase n=1 Tax=unclassified Photobacterium TaxID=2628852 RepID=UPI001C47F1B4|nr:GNAT family N-acetyltransferase [Photobacterium sp. 2_MG-2023]MBV7262656.1 GNAT family N-acetyltransferase [Photobacterium sp. WH24]MCG2837785.1 GNAT family N-acetyltransferase [Photobacterium sp. WH77]MCG2845401.1 GNAT family N-acetyltransferase [Photobacterium sp. WH80]MDO6582183.1 GNAT family N-acetyltransferase [Photobacterium sp. 2_MG-2023]
MNRSYVIASKGRIVSVDDSNFEKLLDLMELYQRFYGVAEPDRKVNYQFFSKFISEHDKGRQFIYLDSSGKAIGFITLYFTYSSVSAVESVLLNDLFVLNECRKKGVGQELIKFAYDWMREQQKYNSLKWATQLHNETAQRLYDKTEGVGKTCWFQYQLK